MMSVYKAVNRKNNISSIHKRRKVVNIRGRASSRILGGGGARGGGKLFAAGCKLIGKVQ